MNRIIAVILLVSVVACSLKPAPVTYMDVDQELAGLTQPALGEKASAVSTDISLRKGKLRNYTYIPVFFWIIFPVTTGIVWLCYIPARSDAREEMKLLDEKQQKVNEILGRSKGI